MRRVRRLGQYWLDRAANERDKEVIGGKLLQRAIRAASVRDQRTSSGRPERFVDVATTACASLGVLYGGYMRKLRNCYHPERRYLLRLDNYEMTTDPVQRCLYTRHSLPSTATNIKLNPAAATRNPVSKSI